MFHCNDVFYALTLPYVALMWFPRVPTTQVTEGLAEAEMLSERGHPHHLSRHGECSARLAMPR